MLGLKRWCWMQPVVEALLPHTPPHPIWVSGGREERQIQENLGLPHSRCCSCINAEMCSVAQFVILSYNKLLLQNLEAIFAKRPKRSFKYVCISKVSSKAYINRTQKKGTGLKLHCIIWALLNWEDFFSIKRQILSKEKVSDTFAQVSTCEKKKYLALSTALCRRAHNG